MRYISLLIVLTIQTYVNIQAQSVTGLQIPDSNQFNRLSFPALPLVAFGPGINEFIIPGFPPVQNQQNIGSCASWSTTYYLYGYYNAKKTDDFTYTVGGKLDSFKTFNPLYVHNQVKFCATSCLACGSSNYHALDFLQNTGAVCFHDFNVSSASSNACLVSPDPNLKPVAANNKIENYAALINPYVKYQTNEKYNLVKNALIQNTPVIIGMPVDNNFKSAFNKPGYIWKSFSGDASKAENHSMVCIGFSDDLDAVRVINSWSRSWGDTGYAWISKSVFDKYLLEAYIINVKSQFLIDQKQLYTYGTTSQVSDVIEISLNNHLKLNVAKEAFFINNRYQEFDDMRIIPSQVYNNSGIVKFYKRSDDKFSLISIATLKIDDPFMFNVEDRKYLFNIYKIAPWRFLGKKALFFTITRLK